MEDTKVISECGGRSVDRHKSKVAPGIVFQVKDQKSELAAVQDSLLESDAKFKKLSADHKRLIVRTETLQQEVIIRSFTCKLLLHICAVESVDEYYKRLRQHSF